MPATTAQSVPMVLPHKEEDCGTLGSFSPQLINPGATGNSLISLVWIVLNV